MTPLKHDRSGRVRYLDEEEEQQLRDALRSRADELRQGRERFNAWRVTRHKPPLPMRTQEYVDHLRPIVLLALNTGLRRGELFSLQWKDVNLRTKLRWRAGRDATRPVDVERRLSRQRQSRKSLIQPFVFPGSSGKRLTTITTAWRRLRKLSYLRNFHFHDLPANSAAAIG